MNHSVPRNLTNAFLPTFLQNPSLEPLLGNTPFRRDPAPLHPDPHSLHPYERSQRALRHTAQCD
jgi:hypothetical protein